jgi:hypothetical protein
MGLLRAALLVLVLCACAPQTDAPAASSPVLPTPAAAESISLADGTAARSWGDGPYGVVLVGDGWEPVAAELALHGMRLLAVAPDALRAGITWLHDAGIDRVAVVAVGDAGVEAAFAVGTDAPELVDQLITVSARGEVARLGVFPKLFVASEGEAAAADATEMAAAAAGDWNAELLVPGDASGLSILDGPGAEAFLDGLLRRLEERR